jgi:hypothetical protein
MPVNKFGTTGGTSLRPVTMSAGTTPFSWNLRRVLRQVPDGGLRSAIECLRAVAFVQFSLRLASALEDSLQSAAAMRQPTLEYHFTALTTTWGSVLESVRLSSR